MSEWQPIETAPAEGFFLVLKVDTICPEDWDCTACVVYRANDGSFLAYMDEKGVEFPYLDGPATHWMPLPPPPEATE